MKKTRAIAIITGLWLLFPRSAGAGEADFTRDFELDECTFADSGRNPYFSLSPGERLLLEGESDGEFVRLQITALPYTRWITFQSEEGERLSVRTRVIEEREWKDGALAEVSRNFYARCKQTNDVYYFGEEVDFYSGGVIVGHGGSWRAGVDGALPGLIMPGRFLLGSRYFQEVAPGIALDQAENVAMGLDVSVPAGELDDCVEIRETTPLEPGHESVKTYCAEVGLVSDGELELVEHRLATRPSASGR